jgi:hypothetical protein
MNDSVPTPEARDWFSVRCIFKDLDSEIYEERITLWKAQSFSHAMALAEAEAREYVEAIGGLEYLNYAQAYHLAEEPESGSEIFSLMRDSSLSEREYLETFFDTGSERQNEATEAHD